MNTLVLVIDRLHAGYLGPYGNGWVGTPAFNRLAAEGFTFDQATSDSPTLADFYRACFTRRHALSQAAPTVSLPTIVSETIARPMTIVTDEPLGDLPGAPEIVIAKSSTTMESAASAEETRLASFFATAIETLAAAPKPFFVWLHTGALGAAWDAPLEYRNRYADAEESLPPEMVEVPRLVLPADYDPDALLGYCQAYAGQVGVLDHCLAGLLAFLDEQSLTDETRIVLLAPRGIALGEHRRIGPWDTALHSETVHLPWIVRVPGSEASACRSQALVQPADLFATLQAWLAGADPSPPTSPLAGHNLLPIIGGKADSVRDRCLTIACHGELGFRTQPWYLRTLATPRIEPDPLEPGWQLFAKPDDRWEVNDVAVRCPEVIELLNQAQQAVVESAQRGDAATLAPLAEALTSPWR